MIPVNSLTTVSPYLRSNIARLALGLALALAGACSEEPVAAATGQRQAPLLAATRRVPALHGDRVVATDARGLYVSRLTRPTVPTRQSIAASRVAEWPDGAVPTNPMVVAPSRLVAGLSIGGDCVVKGYSDGGAEVWSSPALSGRCLPLAFDGELILAVAAGSEDAQIAWIDPESGAIEARITIPASATTGAAALGEGASPVAVGTTRGVSLVSRTPGAETLASWTSSKWVTSLAVIDDTRLAVSLADPIEGGFGDEIVVLHLDAPSVGPMTLLEHTRIAPPSDITAPLIAASACASDDSSASQHGWCKDGLIASGGAHWLAGFSPADGGRLYLIEGTPSASDGLALGDDGRIYSGGAHWLTGESALAAFAAGRDPKVAVVAATVSSGSVGSPLLTCPSSPAGSMAVVQVDVSAGEPSLIFYPLDATGPASDAWGRESGDSENRGRPNRVRCDRVTGALSALSTACDEAAGRQESVVTLPRFPFPLGYGCGAYWQGDGYVFGGINEGTPPNPTPEPTVAAWRLDLDVNEWTGLTPLPIPTFGAVCGAIDGRVIVSGGSSTATQLYDIETNSWAAGAPIDLPRQWAGSAVFQGALWVVGGEVKTPDGKIFSRSVVSYDPAGDRWTPVGDFDGPRYMSAVAPIDGVLYFVGGDMWTKTDENIVYDDVVAIPDGKRFNDFEKVGQLAGGPLSSLRLFTRPGEVLAMHWERVLSTSLPTWTFTELGALVEVSTFSSAVIDTPRGPILVGGGAGGPNRDAVFGWCRANGATGN